MSDRLAVRPFTAGDIPAGMRLKEAANWNQTADDWRRVLAFAPDGCFAIECDGEVQATTTAVCYGRELAWIGMVLTDPAYRGRGLARRLMEHALDYLRGRGVRWVKLDATDMGRPLYERLGFQSEGAIERWMRAPGPGEASGARTGKFTYDSELDRLAFGADRSDVIRALAAIESASLPGAGFAMGRPGSNAAFFGPCVSRTSAAARELLRWFLMAHTSENIYWDILPSNAEAAAIARESGFVRVRELSRMALAGAENAAPLTNRDELVFAAAGFEYG